MTRKALPLSLVALVALVAAGVLLMNCSGAKPPKNLLGGPVTGALAFQHVEKMVSFGPRPPGSVALKECGDYMAAELKKLGLEPLWDRFTDNKRARTLKLPFRNLWVQIDGADPDKGPILALAAHYDTKLCAGHKDPKDNFHFVGAIDGAGGSGVLLELAKHLVGRNKEERKNRKIPNIWLIWFDGEESLDPKWNDDRALFGSRHFAKMMSEDKKLFPNGLAARMKAFVLLDLIGDKNIKIDQDEWSNAQLRNIFQGVADRMGEGDRMFRTQSTIKDDHIPFQKLGVRVIDLIDFHYRIPKDDGSAPHPDYAAWWHTPEDTVDKMSVDALMFAGSLVWHAIPVLEREIYKVP